MKFSGMFLINYTVFPTEHHLGVRIRANIRGCRDPLSDPGVVVGPKYGLGGPIKRSKLEPRPITLGATSTWLP